MPRPGGVVSRGLWRGRGLVPATPLLASGQGRGTFTSLQSCGLHQVCTSRAKVIQVSADTYGQRGAPAPGSLQLLRWALPIPLPSRADQGRPPFPPSGLYTSVYLSIPLAFHHPCILPPDGIGLERRNGAHLAVCQAGRFSRSALQFLPFLSSSPGAVQTRRSLFLPPRAHLTLPSAPLVQRLGGQDTAGAVGGAGPIGNKCPGSPAPAADVLLGTLGESLPGN